MAEEPRAALSPASKDFRTLRDELLARAPIITNRRWTDLNESDIGVGIAEFVIAMQDQLLFYLDNQANEAFLPTSVQRRNVQNLLKLIDYELRGYTAAGGTATFSVAFSSNPPAFPIVIPTGTVVSGISDASGVVQFFTTEEGTIASSGGSVVVPILQGQRLVSPEVFSSDGTEDQRFVLRATGVAKDLLVVKIGSSLVSAEQWTPASNLLSFTANDKVYVPFIGPDGRAFVQFGDGKFGKIPALGSNVYVLITTTSGAVGNLAAGAVAKVVSVVDDDAGDPAPLTVTNAGALAGGTDPESIEDGKRKGPALFSGLNRAMTKGDHIALTESIAGVDKANSWGEQEEDHPDIRLMNRVIVAFSAVDSVGNVIDPEVFPSDEDYEASVLGLKTAIFDLLEARKPITTRPVFKTPEWIDVAVDVLIAVDRTKFDPVLVQGEVRLALQDFWSYPNVSFGQDARLSQAGRIVSGIAGVSWATVRLGRAYSVARWSSTPLGAPIPRVLPTDPAPPLPTFDFQDIQVSRWQLIRTNDFDSTGAAILGRDVAGVAIPHVRVTTTTQVDSPVPDPLPSILELS